MKKDNLSPDDLRKRAEELVGALPRSAANLDQDEIKRLIYDLQVHQAELEMQNEELRRMQSELELSRDRFSDLYNRAPVGYITLDKSAMVSQVNNTMVEMLDTHVSEVIRKPFLVYVSETDKHIFYKSLSEFFNGGPKHTTFRLKRTKGEEFYAKFDARPANGIGLPRAGKDEKLLLMTVSDVTEQVVVERERSRLAKAVEQTEDGILITDTKGVIEYVNPSFERISGYAADELIGKNTSMLKSGKHEMGFYSRMWRKITSGESWSGNIVNRRKDGSLYEERIIISPIISSDGGIAHYVGVLSDITSEAKLARAKNYFTAVTSHELKTPLSKLHLVKVMMDSFARDKADPELLEKAKESLDACYESFSRIISATGTLMDLQLHPLEDDTPFVNARTLLLASLDNVVSRVKHENRDVCIKEDLGNLSEDIYLNIKMEFVQKALEELLSNAIKYTPDGKYVMLEGDVSGQYLVVRIEDEGSGMTSDELDLVKKPFLSLENPNNHFTSLYGYMGGGIGLGLTIATLIAEYSGGKLEISSKGKGQGTVVSLYLPMMRRDEKGV